MSGEQKTALVVLGMHRSGTSALTRVLNIFGAKIGDDLFPAHEIDNPTGYWENNEFVGINERLLKTFGLDYLVSDNLPPGWLESPATKEAKTAIKAVFESQFADCALVTIKDPRLCFLAPLYFEVLNDLGYSIKVVMPLRAPAEVAASLAKRHDNPTVEFEAIWARTVLAAERVSRPYPRAFTSYVNLLKGPLSLHDSLASALNFTWPVGKQEAAKAVGEFINPMLHRNVRSEPSSVPAVGKLHATLASLGSGEPRQDILAYLDSWEAEHLFLFSALRTRIQRLYDLERRVSQLRSFSDEGLEQRKRAMLEAGHLLMQRLASIQARGMGEPSSVVQA